MFVNYLFFSFFFLMIRRPPRSTLFPTRRSSDLERSWPSPMSRRNRNPACSAAIRIGDRKSTRLNSSHQIISYAVFCLKKKKKTKAIYTKKYKIIHQQSQTCDKETNTTESHVHA